MLRQSRKGRLLIGVALFCSDLIKVKSSRRGCCREIHQSEISASAAGRDADTIFEKTAAAKREANELNVLNGRGESGGVRCSGLAVPV